MNIKTIVLIVFGMLLGALLALCVESLGGAVSTVVYVLLVVLLALVFSSYLKNKPKTPRAEKAPKAPKAPKEKKPLKAKGGGKRIGGTVKWFNRDKGFGFIEQDGGGDVFVHHNDIAGSGRKFLREGQKITMIVVAGEKGPQASSVERE